jgi:hypothetical protein
MVPEISLRFCSYDKHRKQLSVASELVGMPPELMIRSHHTDRVMYFKTIGQDHPLFDHDGWDGEQSIYEPVIPDARVETLVIYHQY